MKRIKHIGLIVVLLSIMMLGKLSSNSPTSNASLVNLAFNNASFVAGKPVTFTATAIDAESGDLGASIVWTSSLQGNIGTGKTFIKSDLVVGTHIITAKCTDPEGLSGTATITITITPANTKPVVTITSPLAALSVPAGTAVAFTGLASDAESGSLASLLSWTSSLQGAIGSGMSFHRSDLVVGTHVITAKATDPEGLFGQDSRTITVFPVVVQVPNAPGSISTSLVGTSVRVGWVDNSDNESAFEIRRRQKQHGVFTSPVIVGTVGPNVLTFVDSPDTGKFQYRVRATNTVGNSTWTPWSLIVKVSQ